MGPTPLKRAIRTHDAARVREILEGAGSKEEAARMINEDHSPDCIMDSCSKMQGNALYYAVALRHDDAIISVLLEYDCDLHATGARGETCLHAAARYAHFETCKRLVAKGADLYATDDNGRYPIHSAAQSMYDSSGIISFLLETGNKQDINLKDFNDRTPLHEACLIGNEGSVIALLANGADVNAKSKAGHTPLHMVKRDTGIWNMLVEGGADTTAKNNTGELPGEAV